MFGDRLISRFGPVNWPPRSCDLTPLDYFLWGYVKSLVYADKPQTLDHLEDNIRRVIADIRPHMLEKVIENWTSRLDYIRASRASPMPEIIFKISRSKGCEQLHSHGKHEEKIDDGGFCSHEFTRHYMLLQGCEADTVTSSLDQGVLTITAPKKAIEEPPNQERKITVNVENSKSDGK
ncbi:hypothetical protein TNCV_4530351 [Trichonephila clavipes]|nr:hypothetical protein TNCV_4530351 [Trichonephila clavipes]